MAQIKFERDLQRTFSAVRIPYVAQISSSYCIIGFPRFSIATHSFNQYLTLKAIFYWYNIINEWRNRLGYHWISQDYAILENGFGL